jgi:hypothetical protein
MYILLPRVRPGDMFPARILLPDPAITRQTRLD